MQMTGIHKKKKNLHSHKSVNSKTNELKNIYRVFCLNSSIFVQNTVSLIVTTIVRYGRARSHVIELSRPHTYAKAQQSPSIQSSRTKFIMNTDEHQIFWKYVLLFLSNLVHKQTNQPTN